jgi:hypothetical protein
MANAEVTEALRRLAEAGRGVLLPEAVVQAARDPRSALHNHFTWNDNEAAEKHRLDEARTLIRSVKVIIQTDSRRIEAVAYVRDPAAAGNEAGYVPTATLRTRADEARDALIAEFAQIGARLKRARALAAALGLEDEVEHLSSRVETVRVLVEHGPRADGIQAS